MKVRVIACLALILATLGLPGHSLGRLDAFAQSGTGDDLPPPMEQITAVCQGVGVDTVEAIYRVSTYEIHDDDSVTPNHEYYGLPTYSYITFTGPSDSEWLVLEGDFAYYIVAGNEVTFYNISNWLHIVYRSRMFVSRTPDQITFGVTSTMGDPTDVNAYVTYPATYSVAAAWPSGFSIPAPGRIGWTFLATTGYTLEATFSGLGPDRPLLDLPIDYDGRTEGSAVAFVNAFNTRINSLFDHRYPNYTKDNKFLPYYGTELPDPPDVLCTFGYNCYDGHDGYDFRRRCSPQSPCSDPYAVYPAADGDIVTSLTGWHSQLGCRVTLDHGGGWTTGYAHLKDPLGDHSCNGILIKSGHVTRFQQIGVIGGTGSGGGGENNAHLHFTVKHNGIVVDPSGWEPSASVMADPWASHVSGTASYTTWRYSIRTTQALDPSSGGVLASPTHEVYAVIPAGFYTQQLLFNLSSVPVAGASATLASTGHSFSLTAVDGSGTVIHNLGATISLQVNFDAFEMTGIDRNTLAVYTWDATTSKWVPLPTVIDWNSWVATAQTDHLSLFALLGKPLHVFLPLVIR